MAINNAINISLPLTVANGGTGLTTIGADGIIYGNGSSSLGTTSAGIAGNVLMSSGAGVAPIYQDIANKLVLISTQTISSPVNSIIFNSGITSTYNIYLLLVSDMFSTAQTAVIVMDVSTDGGATYKATGYSSFLNLSFYSFGSTIFNVTSDIYIQFDLISDSTTGTNTALWCHNLTNGANAYFMGDGTANSVGGGAPLRFYAGSQTTWPNVNAFRIRPFGGLTTIDGGSFSLYGLKQT